MSDPSGAEDDAAVLSGLLRRQAAICTGCIGAGLGFTMERVLAAVHDLARTEKIEQGMRRCPACGRTKWVVTLEA